MYLAHVEQTLDLSQHVSQDRAAATSSTNNVDDLYSFFGHAAQVSESAISEINR